MPMGLGAEEKSFSHQRIRSRYSSGVLSVELVDPTVTG